jgi:hypothetical protein
VSAPGQRLQRRAWLLLAWLLLALAVTAPVERIEPARAAAALVAGLSRAKLAAKPVTAESLAGGRVAIDAGARGARAVARSSRSRLQRERARSALAACDASAQPALARADERGAPARDGRWLYLINSTLLC